MTPVRGTARNAAKRDSGSLLIVSGTTDSTVARRCARARCVYSPRVTPSWTELSIATPHGTIRAQTRGEGPLLVWTHGVFHPIDVDDHSAIGATLAGLEGLRVVRYDTRGH